MKKKAIIIEGSFKILDFKIDIKDLKEETKKLISELAHDYDNIINFKIGQSDRLKNAWVVEYITSGQLTIKANLDTIKTFKNKVRTIFNSNLKDIKRKDIIIYG